MNDYFLDMHIHIGRTLGGQAVKITGSRDLTLFSIIRESAERKGIDIIGIIDSASPPVMAELRQLTEKGQLFPMPGGGLSYRHRTTVLLGAEVEIGGPHGGAAHFGVWLPDLERLEQFSLWLAKRVKNPTLSSQRIHATAEEIQQLTVELEGMFVINHAFTPHKGLYGQCVRRAGEMLDLSQVTALELGLSADTAMADLLSELQDITFLSNSDAHSLSKIAREYNLIAAQEPTFQEVKKALLRQEGRRVKGNFGLDPRLGKYHRTYCPQCGTIAVQPPPVLSCPSCRGTRIIRGVIDRIVSIADRSQPVHPAHRPPYRYQIPLEFIPHVGKRTLERLLSAFGSEMNILHHTTEEDLARVVGGKVARNIILAREGQLSLREGGGGRYGRVRIGEWG